MPVAAISNTDSAPRRLCLLRLSALGDVTHVLPLIRRLQRVWPQTELVWIIGAVEQRLLPRLDGVTLVPYPKRSGWRGALELRRRLRESGPFDALLHMQVSLRANLLALTVPARRRIGFDTARARDFHRLVSPDSIPARSGEHVLDALRSFAEPLGLPRDPDPPTWQLPISNEARDFTSRMLPGDDPWVLISPCSSHVLRNGSVASYAAVADDAIARGYRVALIGGPSPLERSTADQILSASQSPPVDLVGKDTLPELAAMLKRAVLLVAPDSGPMHIANAVGTKVLGLHAASNPARSGPYSDRRFCVDRYDDAARRYFNRPGSQLPWGTKIERQGVMDLVTVDDVRDAFDRFDDANRNGALNPAVSAGAG